MSMFFREGADKPGELTCMISYCTYLDNAKSDTLTNDL
jgi:hypothetical protein